MIIAVRFYGDNLEIFLKGFKIRIEFSFIFILCLSLVLGYKNTGLLILFCFLHEIGHLLALVAVGEKPDSLNISFFGIALKYSCKFSIAKEALVIASGPIINVIMFLALQDEINLFLAALNLLPVFPLDGGRLINLVFPLASKYISIAFLAIMLIASVYVLIYHSVFSLLLLCLYLIVFNMRSL